MPRKLYTKSKIFFKDPYVIRMDFHDKQYFQGVLSHVRECINGSWGYSNIEYTEFLKPHNYWCFANTEDALQFTLFVKDTAKRVRFWPDTVVFTIIEQ